MTRQPKLAFASVSRSHAGLRRAVNEDRVLDRPDAGLWAVADGMGGHEAGDVAAARIVDALAATKLSGSGYSRLADVTRTVNRVNAALTSDPAAPLSNGGSTLVALLAYEDHCACLWAGDSRGYVMRGGKLSAMTRDHSIVQHLIDRGDLDEDDRKAHPNAHVITRAIGAAPRIELDRRFAEIAAGDIFLLCSDGLTSCVDDDEIAKILQVGDADHSADQLISQVLARGAPDNVSLVVVQAVSR